MSILIIGLGNPGKNYAQTRHNAGFMAVDALAKVLLTKWKFNKSAQAEICETRYLDKKIILAKPQTFMNLSGTSVASLVNKYKLTSTEVWVISDDVALPLGTLRVRAGGSAGGHNGLKSIIDTLGTHAFVRFRLGIDAPPAKIPLDAYVVKKFSQDERKTLTTVIEKTCEVILQCIAEGVRDTSVST